MSAKQPSELLYDSEATLRLVDTAIQDMGDLEQDDASPLEARLRAAIGAADGTGLGLTGLSDLLAKGYAEILGVLDSLRQSRSLLERAAVEKLQHTHDKLREVSNATETAATDILNGLDRANTMVDDLDAYALTHGEPDGRGASTRTALRDELFALMGHMQFQDITSQQLTYASAVLTEMEARLTNIARAFDPAVFGHAPLDPGAPAATGPVTYDPNASTQDRAARQAVADEIVARRTGT
jgi:chemotaxis regulatin CheY-phosphate phosphatase CheZ